MPDDHIFKLAFSREVISRDKLETEKKMLPHIQDYEVDPEEWSNLQKSMLGELKESVNQIIHEGMENAKDIKYKIQTIKALRLNIGHSNSIELWPTLYTRSERYYIVSVPSVIEDTIMPAVIADKWPTF